MALCVILVMKNTKNVYSFILALKIVCVVSLKYVFIEMFLPRKVRYSSDGVTFKSDIVIAFDTSSKNNFN